jgi:drug/metabolite transporter (DMT)-like permease
MTSDSKFERVNVPSQRIIAKVFLVTVCALVAFAANSVLCRFALGTGGIDAAGFTSVRLVSGAVVLFLIFRLRTNQLPKSAKGSWLAGLMLFLYAITFSYAYIDLDTGTGALILFGAVQISMICLSIIQGNRLIIVEWFGMAIACMGLVYLVLPGVSAPSALGFLLMTTAGIAWGVYTLKGRGSENPLADTAYNFLRTLPLVMILVIITFRDFHFTAHGVTLAIVSGGITSGVGYTLWYIALRNLTATQAAVAQLSVPLIAALGGIIFMAESITIRLSISSIIILGGIFLVVMGRFAFIEKRPGKSRNSPVKR